MRPAATAHLCRPLQAPLPAAAPGPGPAARRAAADPATPVRPPAAALLLRWAPAAHRRAPLRGAAQSARGRPRARSARCAGVAGAAGAPGGGRTAGSAACCRGTASGAPAGRGPVAVCTTAKRRGAAIEGATGEARRAGPGRLVGEEYGACGTPHCRMQCRPQCRTCARLAVDTVRCVVWNASTPGSQGMPQCASMARVVPS